MRYKITPKDDGLLLEFFIKPVSRFIKISLLTIILICVAIPIVILLFADLESLMPIVFSMLIFWVPGFFLLRVLLWNSYGREVVFFKAGQINYFCDFKLFQDRKITLDMSELEFGFIEDRTEKVFFPLRNDPLGLIDDEQVIGYLQLRTADGALNFSQEISFSDVSRLEEEVKSMIPSEGLKND